MDYIKNQKMDHNIMIQNFSKRKIKIYLIGLGSMFAKQLRFLKRVAT